MRVLVIGGYGNFGKRLIKSLLLDRQIEVVAAGRTRARLDGLQSELLKTTGRTIGCITLDVFDQQLSYQLASIGPDIVVNAVGPFQKQVNIGVKENHYIVARACLAFGCHYVDLADDRCFVSGFSKELNNTALKRNVSLITGASTVPALTDAVLRCYEPQFANIDSLYYGISPGNRTERGEGTIGSILSYTGQSFTTLEKGKDKRIWGWQDLTRYDFGYPLGKRWMSNCNIPDIELLPQEFPSLKDIKFQAGLEVTVLHVGLWMLSFLTRWKVIKNWQHYTKVITSMSRWFESWGSDSGGMFIDLSGIDKTGAPKKLHWQLVAEKGVGPNVPTIAAEIVVKKLMAKSLPFGAQPCINLFTMEEFFNIAKRWGIYYRVERHFDRSSAHTVNKQGEVL
ncbi:saccharopine dehydrogenase family protein [Pleionea sediminis]|uniref:saccharopine dehydrogenase family protein n=1 Tax=Pleionea sediminis TaxID=2569479 RepID=UPI0013DE79A6|nr:saccharopine dehydrogenase NADP-binding domain-containing protein [Pleionea sediminis]